MKTQCEHCHKNLKSKTREPFDKLVVGRIICPHCNKENKRYISEFDLLLYLPFTNFLCAVGVISIMYVLDFVLFDNVVLGAILLISILVVGFFIVDQLAKYIYNKAPFKKEWKNKQIDEDSKAVSRRLNYQLTLFLLISALMGINREMLDIYVVLSVAIIIFTVIKAYLAYKIELKKAK